MIPLFPEFKKLELADRVEINAFTLKYPPYSDFNFTSMWVWNIKNAVEISKLNANLVVKFSDYITGEPFYSFFGGNQADLTSRALLDLAKQNGMQLKLKLVPEMAAKAVMDPFFTVEEDRDNFDYIYQMNEIEGLEGGKYLKKRYSINYFKRLAAEAEVKIIALEDPAVQKDIFELTEIWEKNKVEKKIEVEAENERMALNRLFAGLKSFSLTGMGVFLGGKMISFTVLELVDDEYAISHFHKADASYRGVYDFLMQEKARHLTALKINFFNYEQDLGILNIRQAKSSFRPVHFLKKYIIRAA